MHALEDLLVRWVQRNPRWIHRCCRLRDEAQCSCRRREAIRGNGARVAAGKDNVRGG